MEDQYELIRTLSYVQSCGFLLAVFFVGIAATVAGAQLKKSAGVWVFAVSVILFGLVNLVSTGLDLAEIDYEIMQFFYAATSMVTLVLNVGMLIGVALIKPLHTSHDRTSEVRG